MLAITVGLGVWQVQRLHWKTGLLAQVDHAEAAPPVRLPSDPQPFEKIVVTGHLRDDLPAFYGSEVRATTSGPLLGAQVVVPLERADGPPILVDRGWLPEGATLPPAPGPTDIVGYVRPPEKPGWFAPSTDLSAKRFWTLDPAAMGAALGLPQVAPFTVVALGPSGGVPEPAQSLPRPPNDHLGYAITWFGLAACLLVVFATFVRRTLRECPLTPAWPTASPASPPSARPARCCTGTPRR